MKNYKNIQDVRHVTAFCIFICLGINTLSEVICTEIGKNDYQMYDTSNHIDISDFCSMMHILGTKGFYVVRLILSDTVIL